MNISKENLVSVNEILADVLKLVGDEGFEYNSRGYYVSQIQQALQELAFDTFFDERVEYLDVPECLRLPMPKGAFNIRQMYLFNGDKCNFSNAQNVYWKRNYITNGNGYLARDQGNNNRDPFYPNRVIGRYSDNDPSYRRTNALDSISNMYYFNVQDGDIMFSSTCRSFGKVAIVYNGVGANIGEVPFVPMLFREAIKAWVADAALMIKLGMVEPAEFNRWQFIWQANNQRLNKPFTGLWAEAEVRAKSIDSKQREDLKEYLSRLEY